MMICLRLEGVGVRAVGQGAVSEIWSIKARREVESVPKRLAEDGEFGVLVAGEGCVFGAFLLFGVG